jgi:hypothetical protein
MVSKENGDFKLVKYKSRRQSKTRVKVNSKEIIVECDSVNEIIHKINAALTKFKESQFHQTLLNEVKKILHTLNFTGLIDIICYGLGNFSQHNCSKYQLAALLTLKEAYSANIYIYDPLFGKNEIESLKQLNLQVIDKNEEGKRIINNHITLIFMPHCSKQLTNNFLYANWSPLIRNCILLGNSWSELECHTTNASLKQTAYFIYKLKPYVTEIKLKNNFEYPNTFSGTSLHIFSKEKLDKVPADFWNKTPELLCNDKDPEFINKQ